MSKKIQFTILTSLILFLLMSLNAYSIQREEFLPCYDDFSNCDSNCTQPITKNMTLYFPGYNCPLYVSYLL